MRPRRDFAPRVPAPRHGRPPPEARTVNRPRGVRVYLDCNATARIRPEVVDVLVEALHETGNASSVHAAGRRARRRVEDARREVAALAGASPDQIVFTSGGTEADNQILRASDPERTLVSAVEHPAVLDACPGAVRVPVDSAGVVDLSALEAACRRVRPVRVALMLANNETGVVQPVAEAAEIARRFGARLHCDAVQAAGKLPVDFAALGADSMALSAHKLGGPQGVGALVVRDAGGVDGLLRGGRQERGLRGGTENVACIAAFGAAARIAREELPAAAALAELRDGMERTLAADTPGFEVFGAAAPRLPNTSKMLMPGVPADTQVIAFDLAGVAVSAGAACSSGRVAPPYVLSAMGVPDDRALCAIRVSLGWDTTADDVARFVAAWRGIRERCGALRKAG